MRESVGAVALICKEQEDQVLWLAQWNTNWQRYHFVGGHKRPNESFRDCILREVGEELRLTEGVDFTVAVEAKAHLQYVAWSESAGTETSYEMELFEVTLNGASAFEKVDANLNNRWLSEREILSQRCNDGRPVSPTIELLLRKMRESQPR